MKKRIVFMLIDMNIGGTEKALLNMLSSLSRDQYTITVFLLHHRGALLRAIPNDVEVISLNGFKDIAGRINYAPKQVILEHFKNREIRAGCRLFFLHVILKITKDRRLFFKSVLKGYPHLDREFDIAVAYAGPMDFISYYIVNKIRAQKRIQWIHFDVTKIGFDKRFATRVYHDFDKVFVVSEEAEQKLKNRLPKLAGKIKTFPNIVYPNDVISQAKNGSGFKDGFTGTKILTVGRLSFEKGQDLGMKALLKLKADGFNVRWYCIGDGGAKKDYEQLIEKYQLHDTFILLGADPNPYPYISQCDIYVQPSRHEGYCITLAEARILRKPIVTTNFTGAKEQIKDGETGLIVEADDQALYKGIKKLLINIRLNETFTMNLAAESHIDSEAINDYFTKSMPSGS